MNFVVHAVFRFAGLFTGVVLGLAAQLHSAENPPASPTSAPATYTAEQKASLDVLDGVMARFEALLNRDDDANHKAATQIVLDGFKQRRAALGQTYDQGRYDELRVDLNLEYQRLASWMRPPKTPAKNPLATVPTTTGS